MYMINYIDEVGRVRLIKMCKFNVADLESKEFKGP